MKICMYAYMREKVRERKDEEEKRRMDELRSFERCQNINEMRST